MMRILTLANTPLRRALGSGYVILNYAEGLRRRGHVVRLIGPPEIDWPRSGRRAIRYRQMAGMFFASAPKAIAGYDVVEFYGGESWLAVTRLARHPQRPLLVAHSNGLEPHAERLLAPLRSGRRPYQFDLSRLYSQAFRGADGLVTVSDFDRDFALAENYLPPERIISIDNPLPEEFLGQPMNDKPEPVVVVSGSWIPRKGCQLIRDAIPGFLRAHPAWKLTLVGVGGEFSAADQFPGDCLAQIEVIAHADRLTDLRSLLKNSAIALQASHYESFGLAAAEAMASGCALVATAVGFAARLRHGQEAWLLADGATPSDLTNALKHLASDPPTRQRIANGGYRRAQQLIWETAIDRYEDFLLGLSRR